MLSMDNHLRCRWLSFGFAMVLSALACHSGNAQQVSRPEPVIAVHQNIDDVLAIVRERKLRIVERGFAETKRPDDDIAGDLTFDIGPEMYARLYYSKSNRQLTAIAICTFPKGNQSKTTYSVFEAASMRFEENGDVSIRFIKL
jgi:hypothetical protein